MGLIRVILLTFFAIISGLIPSAQAAWNDPQIVITLGWGSGVGQVAIEHGDTEDSFPHIFVVDEQVRILISDGGNVRLQIITPDGSLSKIVAPIGWPVDIFGWPLRLTLLSNSRVLIKRSDRYQIYNYDGTLSSEFKGVAAHIIEITALPDDTIVVYKSDEKKFYNYSPTGQLIKTSAERPLELGVVSEKYMAPGQYKVTVKYPDKEWGIVGAGVLPKYMRDMNGNLYGFGEVQAFRYTSCGKELAVLAMPEKNVQEISRGPAVEPKIKVLEEYGSPVVAPNGDVYTWKRTPDKYSILKWTWVDDPNVPTGPDAPTSLAVAASISGLYLTWAASPSDPGCVTSYEIYRATSAGGVGSTIGTVTMGTVKYNDTTATAGTTYYYKIRAVAGSELSPYTGEVSGKR